MEQWMNSSKQPEPQQPDYDPEEIPTFQAVEKVMEKKLSAVQNQYRQMMVNQMEEQAKSRYADYDVVLNEYTQDILRGNPDLYNVIMNSKNPAETAYALGKTHPKYTQQIQQQTARQIVQKIDSNVNAPATLGGVGGVSSQRDQAGFWKSASKQEIERAIMKAKGLA
jgi:hypothetical protein